AGLGLEAKRSQRAVVGSALGDASAEYVGVRQKVNGHECAVRMSADSDPITIRDSHVDDLVDCRLCACNELLDISVVWLLSVDADDRHRRSIEDAIAVHEQHHIVLPAGALELVR